MTFAQDLEDAASPEIIESIVIGKFGWDFEDEDIDSKGVPVDKKYIVMSWEEAKPFLNYEYDRGYGAPDCHAIYAWTATKTLYVVQYDGSTGIYSIPRIPINTEPSMPGG